MKPFLQGHIECESKTTNIGLGPLPSSTHCSSGKRIIANKPTYQRRKEGSSLPTTRIFDLIIAGIDYSYTSPAICVFDTTKELKYENLRFFGVVKEKVRTKLAGEYGPLHITAIEDYDSPEQRFKFLADWAEKILVLNNVQEVVLEGYAYGSRAGLIFQIAENTSLLKQVLYRNNIPFTDPKPTEVKKAYTGKGNTKKEPIIDQVQDELGISFADILGVSRPYAKPIDDLCDSFMILKQHEFFKKDII